MDVGRTSMVAGLLLLAAQGCGDEFAGGGGGTAAAGGPTTSTTGSGASGAANGGTGGLGASGGTGGVAGGSVGSEICLNGIDDDGDSAIDCADADCQVSGFACLTVPNGWQGPVALLPPEGGDLCDPGWQSDEWAGGTSAVAPTPACEECLACAAPSQSGECPTSVQVTAYGDIACAADGMTFTVSSGSCTTFAANRQSFEPAVPLPIAAGTCSTVAGTPAGSCSLVEAQSRCSLPAPGVGAGCGLEGVCAPSAPNAAICVYQTGEESAPCPVVEGFSQRIVLWAGVEDTRDCSCPCSFGCSARIQLFGGNQCTSGATNVDVKGECQAMPVNAAGHAMKLIDPAEVCRNDPPELQGGCDVTSPVTYCCIPAPEDS